MYTSGLTCLLWFLRSLVVLWVLIECCLLVSRKSKAKSRNVEASYVVQESGTVMTGAKNNSAFAEFMQSWARQQGVK
jgi:hypothetical protein